jgi:nitroreductase
LHPLIRDRFSPRAFLDRAVPAAVLRRLFEAARVSQSSGNEQPWRFIVTTRDDSEPFGRLAATLTGNNRLWAPHAPVLALSVARLVFERDGKPNRHAYHDVGLAMQNLTVQATADGLGVHPMAGFDVALARAAFAIPPEFEPVAAIAIGYAGDPETLPEPVRERDRAPRTRRALEQQVFGGVWGESAALVSATGGDDA